MEKYFTMSKASDDEKCQATLLMTNGTVGSFIQGVIRGKKYILQEYYRIESNPH